MSRVHLIDAQGSIIALVPTLLLHAIRHEESLVWFLASEHSVHPVSWRLALSTSIVISSLVDERVSQWTISHRVLIHTVLFDVLHHVC